MTLIKSFHLARCALCMQNQIEYFPLALMSCPEKEIPLGKDPPNFLYDLSFADEMMVVEWFRVYNDIERVFNGKSFKDTVCILITEDAVFIFGENFAGDVGKEKFEYVERAAVDTTPQWITAIYLKLKPQKIK